MEQINIFINELKQNNIPKYKLVGISAEVILSTELFYRNSDLKEFIMNIYSIPEQFKDYVYASRTVLISRIARLIIDGDDKRINESRRNLLSFLRSKQDQGDKSNTKSSSNTKVIWD